MDSDSNQDVKFFLANWFFPHKSFNLNPTLTGHTHTRDLNTFEINKFNIETTQLPLKVLIGYKLEQNYEKFNSKSYFSLATTYAKLDKSDHLINYSLSNDYSFGIIDYFIQINNVVYCVIYKIEIILNNFDLENDSFYNIFQTGDSLSNIFFKGKILEEQIIIHSNCIRSKFISINAMSYKVISKTQSSRSLIENEIFFSEFISKHDHN